MPTQSGNFEGPIGLQHWWVSWAQVQKQKNELEKCLFFSGGNLPFPWNRYLLDQKTLSWFTISWSKLMACMSMKPPRRNFSNPPMFNRAPTNCVRPIKNMHLAEKQQKKNCVTFSPNLAWGCPWWSKTATKFLVHYNSSQPYFFDISVRYFGQNKIFYIQWLTQTQKASASYFSPGCICSKTTHTCSPHARSLCFFCDGEEQRKFITPIYDPSMPSTSRRLFVTEQYLSFRLRLKESKMPCLSGLLFLLLSLHLASAEVCCFRAYAPGRKKRRTCFLGLG